MSKDVSDSRILDSRSAIPAVGNVKGKPPMSVDSVASAPAPTLDALYRDPGRSPAERAADLLDHMTRDEKVAQLGAAWPAEVSDGITFDPDKARAALAQGIGQITRISGSTLLAAEAATRMGNDIQRFLIERTRLGIPAILHEESLHGLTALDSVVHPQSIGLAATWEPDRLERMGQLIGKAARARGARLVLSPVFDLARDPRWGRTEETYGEDTYLVTAMGAAYVRGVQAHGVLCCGKHFVAHGMSEGGMNRAPVHLGARELREQQMLPFEAAVRQERIGTMMHAYHEIDGVPCMASHELLTEILRDEWGFEGVVVADYDGINELILSHRVTDDQAVAAAMTLRAGLDQELPRTLAYGEPLRRALDEGLVDEATLDLAVMRVLRLKFELGLFESPYTEPAGASVDQAPERALALESARKSLVLLENDGTLPLASDLGRVALIGPSADDARNQLGDYAHQLHVETLLRNRDVLSSAIPVADSLQPSRASDGMPTVLDELRARLGEARVAYAAGCGLLDGSDEDIAAAVDVAAAADVAVLVMGERSGLTDDALCGETRDRLDLGLPGRQQELLQAVAATGTPVVLVLMSGRPLAVAWAAQHCAAVLHAWVPGEHGAQAIVDILTGVASPGGKLPISVPRTVGQVPIFYSHRPTGGHTNWNVEYVDGSNLPLWPFGFGRSYTTFELSDLRLSSTEIPADGEVEVSATVRNTGERAGDEVVQLYVRDVEASLTRPVKELRGFARVTLEPGEARTVSFTLAAEQLAFVDVPGRWLVEPGEFRLMVGTSSADLPLETSLTVGGTARHLDARSRYLTPVRVR
jgi:beta-glucosidase